MEKLAPADSMDCQPSEVKGDGEGFPQRDANHAGTPETEVLEIRPKSEVLRDVVDSQALGLRFLEVELGRSIQPNVEIAGRSVDGAIYSADGVLEAIVEVKFIEFRQQVRYMSKAAREWRRKWEPMVIAPSVHLYYVVVVGKEDLIADAAEAAASLSITAQHWTPLSLHTKVYGLEQLRRRFRVDL